MSQPQPEQGKDIPNKLSPWIGLIGGAITLLSSIVGVMLLPYPFGKFDITVWIQQEVPINLPAEVVSAPLILTYDGNRISRVTFLKARLSNTGSAPVGDTGKWELNIRTDDGSRIVLLPKYETKPLNLEMNPIDTSVQSNLKLQIGLFNPGDFVDLRLMIINPVNVEHPFIDAQTRIPSLSSPIVTRKTLEDRLTYAYYRPIAILLFIILLIVVMVWAYRLDKTSFATLKEAAKTILGGIVLGIMYAAFVGYGVTWVLVKILMAINKQLV